MKADFELYPIYRQAYIHSFDKMLISREEAGLKNMGWNSGEDVFKWWVGDDPRQITMFDALGHDDMDEALSVD